MIDIKTVYMAQTLIGCGIERYIYDAHFYYETRVSLSAISVIIGDLHYEGVTDSEIVEDYTYAILTEDAIPLQSNMIGGGSDSSDMSEM